MPTELVGSQTSDGQACLAFLQDLLSNYRPRNFVVRTWDGKQWDVEPGQTPRFTIILKHAGSLRNMFWPPRVLTFAEGYLRDDFDVEGDVESFWALARFLFVDGEQRHLLERRTLETRLARFPASQPVVIQPQVRQLTGAPHTPGRDQQAVIPHYGVSNEFYSLWLDSRMVYTCAYFTAPDQDIDTAQAQKLRHVCRKLRLRPGERFLDLGCGFGGLALYAAQHYGVHSLGITITPAQAEWANEQIARAGMKNRCEVRTGDYREIDGRETFDKVACVGMLEHVGESCYRAFFEQVLRLTRAGGALLDHHIVQRATKPLPVGWTFIYRYVFPDTELRSIDCSLRAAEEAGWEVRDVESLREHYMLTTRRWLQRLEAKAEEARRCTDDFTFRVFRLYLAASAYGFSIGQPSIYQSLLVKPDQGRSDLPLTRADWYV